MLYGVLRTWLIAKEIIQRSAKAMKKNIDPLDSNDQMLFHSPFPQKQMVLYKEPLMEGLARETHQTSAQGFVKESQQEVGSESNLLTGKCEARMSRSQVHMRSDGKAAGLENPGSGMEDLEVNCNGSGKLSDYHSS